MDASAIPPLPSTEQPNDAPVIVAKGTGEELQGYSLVLSAVGIDHGLDLHSGSLLVSAEDADRALYHLNQYKMENIDWPPQPDTEIMPERHENPPTAPLMLLFILFYWFTGPWQADNSWFLAGAVDSRAILTMDQWYRLLTALTLHADLVHLVGNCIIGGFMVHLLCRITGYGLGWFLLFLAGGAGNLVNIFFREQQHFSVGFSTAVFAAIGIFTGLRLKHWRMGTLREIIAPLGAGVGLLAFLGTEGIRTDIGAHFSGFSCGIAAGILIRVTGLLRDGTNPQLQNFLFLTTLAILLFSWMLAVNATQLPPV